VSKFVLGEHESVEVLADAIYAAQVDKRGRSYGGNFADVELPADEVAFIFKFLLTYLEFLIVLCILCQHIPVILFVHATFAVSILDPVTIVSVWSSTYSFPQICLGLLELQEVSKGRMLVIL
jgi:hypothetical protein